MCYYLSCFFDGHVLLVSIDNYATDDCPNPAEDPILQLRYVAHIMGKSANKFKYIELDFSNYSFSRDKPDYRNPSSGISNAIAQIIIAALPNKISRIIPRDVVNGRVAPPYEYDIVECEGVCNWLNAISHPQTVEYIEHKKLIINGMVYDDLYS